MEYLTTVEMSKKWNISSRRIITFCMDGRIDGVINLQEVERNKIRCGKLHFQAVSEQIRFDWINSYEDFRQKFGVAESE